MLKPSFWAYIVSSPFCLDILVRLMPLFRGIDHSYAFEWFATLFASHRFDVTTMSILAKNSIWCLNLKIICKSQYQYS